MAGSDMFDCKVSTEKEILYIIVVHGIGEQRKKESLLPVINGFAHVCKCIQSKPGSTIDKTKPLTQGMLSGHDETPWVEYDGVPTEFSYCKEFVADSIETKGQNIRFVDMHWADVMQGHFDQYGESVETWTQSLIDRLNTKLKLSEQGEDFLWMTSLLMSIRKSVLPIKNLLSTKQRIMAGSSHELNDTVFNRFLGDAQLYGEYPQTRGEAVYRFHEKMHELHQAHYQHSSCKDDEGNIIKPRYVILAHSLGSIMSFDSLILAHGKTKTFTHEHDGKVSEYEILDVDVLKRNTPLRGYESHDHKNEKETKRPPGVDWLKYVDTFITLGSPIDKYLLLWSQNYTHLINTKRDSDVAWLRHMSKEHQAIKHYNYCDEQDPVGHELNTAYTAEVVQELFERKDDAVFMRYNVPGVAHINYWDDVPLLRYLISFAINGTYYETNEKEENLEKPENAVVNKEVFTFDIFQKKAYWSTLRWSYLYIPLTSSLLTTIIIMFIFSLLTPSINLFAAIFTMMVFPSWVYSPLRELFIRNKNNLDKKFYLIEKLTGIIVIIAIVACFSFSNSFLTFIVTTSLFLILIGFYRWTNKSIELMIEWRQIAMRWRKIISEQFAGTAYNYNSFNSTKSLNYSKEDEKNRKKVRRCIVFMIYVSVILFPLLATALFYCYNLWFILTESSIDPKNAWLSIMLFSFLTVASLFSITTLSHWCRTKNRFFTDKKNCFKRFIDVFGNQEKKKESSKEIKYRDYLNIKNSETASINLLDNK
jgi:hypothetical protein